MFSVKALIVARREFLALVRTKAFVIGIVLAPALMAMAALLVPAADNPGDGPREVALIDHSGHLAAPLELAAHDAGLTVTAHPPAAVDDSARARLDAQVRDGSLAAVVVIGSDVVTGNGVGPAAQVVLTVRNVASRSTLWLHRTLDDLVQLKRLEAAGIDPDRARQILAGIELQVRLPESSGEHDPNLALKGAITPLFTLMLVFLAIMSSAPYMLHSVIEEKQQRIAEVLLGSMSPFDLMAGKLLGCASAGVTVVLVYAAMAFAGASHYGVGGVLSPAALLLSLAHVLVALVMFGSLFLAAGAAATELKDAQGLMTPLTLVMIIPMMTLSELLGNPDGALAVGLSLFPLTAPMILPVRLATTSVPVWQVVVSVLGTLLSTLVIVWAAGRIFRIGILSQGRAPRLSELLRWIRSS
jgi:ABC-2 type transport system permease protein